jgi:cytochrome c biogenesis factor
MHKRLFNASFYHILQYFTRYFIFLMTFIIYFILIKIRLKVKTKSHPIRSCYLILIFIRLLTCLLVLIIQSTCDFSSSTGCCSTFIHVIKD